MFVVYESNGIASCAIEKAHTAGDIDFKKPISCHLYPIRAKKYVISLVQGTLVNFFYIDLIVQQFFLVVSSVYNF